MKLYYKAVLLLLSICFVSCKKDELRWTNVHQVSINSATQLNNALFTPNGIGILVGGERFDEGKIWTSSDWGYTWQQQSIQGNPKGMFGLCLSPSKEFYTSGMYMSVSKNFKNTLQFYSKNINPREEFISSISFGQDSRGVAVTALGTDSGAVVLLDSNLAMTNFMRLKFSLWDVLMLNANVGYAVGSGKILKTFDGGTSWEIMPIDGDNFTSVSALDSNNIIVCGLSGYIVVTNNAGKSWTRLRNGSNITLPHYQLWDIYYDNLNEAYAVGEKGLIIFTNDGGKHWSQFKQFTQNHLRFITPIPNNKLLIGGENGTLFIVDK